MKVQTRAIWRAGLVGAAVAAVANLAVYAVGRMAGVEFALPPGGFSPAVGASEVILTVLVTFVLGTAIAALASRWGAGALRVVQVVGAVFALVTAGAPLFTAVGAGSGVLLASMHVIAGVVWVLAMERARHASIRPAAAPGVESPASR